MAAYIFLRWVLIVIYSSQIRHFHEIMQLPTLRNSNFCSYSHSLPCVRKTHDGQILHCVCVLNAVQSRYGEPEFMVLHLASCTRMYTRTHGSRQHCEKTIKTGIFLRWELHYFTKMTDLTTKTHRRKMYAAMECESVDIGSLLQVTSELWSFENFLPQKRASIVRTLYLCTEKESYIGLVKNQSCDKQQKRMYHGCRARGEHEWC